MKFKFYFLCIGLILIQSSFAQAENSYYYCHFYPKKTMSSFDRIIQVSESHLQKTLHIYTRKEEPLLKTYNENNKIIAVHKNRFLSPNEHSVLQFLIFELDLSQNTLTRYLAYHNMSAKDFQTAYQILFSQQALSEINKNPEILKYLPVEPVQEDFFSYAFAKKPMLCHSISFLEYIRDTFLLFIISILSAG